MARSFLDVAPTPNNKETLCTRKTTRVRDMYSRHQRGTSPRDICRVESAPSMWSGGVKIQIENHLANLPVVPSDNKFRFTRVGGLRVMDPCARAEKRGALTCIKDVSTIPLYIWNPRGIFRGIETDLFIARSSGNSRAEYTAVQFAEPKVTCARRNVNKGTVER